MKIRPEDRRLALAARFPGWIAKTTAQVLDDATELYGENDLFINEQGSLSYREMRDWSLRLAEGLVAKGLKKGEHVALLLANYAEFAAIKFALARIGAVAVPLNFNLRAAELRYALKQSDSVMLVTMDRFRDHDYLTELDAVAEGWEHGAPDALPKLRSVLVVRTQSGEGRGVTLAAIERNNDAAAMFAETAQQSPLATCDILYTSGTTGSPKGVMITHDALMRAAYASAYHRAFEDGRRIAHALPMYHVFGYVECLLASILVGGCVISHLVFDAETMVRSIERHKATDLICLPMMTLKVLDQVRSKGIDAPTLSAVFNSGGVNPPGIWADIRALLKVDEVVTAYGMTETTASTTCTLPEGDDAHLLTSNGRLKLAGMAGDPSIGGFTAIYKTIDVQTGEDTKPGDIGELVARGPIVTKGYYNKPEENEAAFTPDGWLRTGDLGRIDADGYLSLTGRIKETYRCGGEMVTPREVELVIEEHPLVLQALVVGVPDMKMGEIGCACLVLAGSVAPSPDEIIALCTERLARFKVPRAVLVFDAADIPLTVTGRPQKHLLAERARARLSP